MAMFQFTRKLMEIAKKLEYGICNNHSGKMTGMSSFSTSCRCNEFCQKRMKNGNSICAHCFSYRQTAIQKTLEKKLIKNTELITKEIYPVEVFPSVLKPIFRLESFGDLNNDIQLINYFRFCEANPFTTFALWTKNTWILKQVRELGYKKPSNLIIIQSSCMVNKRDEIRDEWVDKTFTVWDKTYKDADFINCGNKRCAKCQLCYHLNGVTEINEVIK